MAREIKGTREFIVEVLWIHGRSIGDIAAVVRWTPGQVRGHVNREYSRPHSLPRAEMPDEMRAELLTLMKATRLDEGRLREEHFKPLPLARTVVVEPLSTLRKSWVAALVIAEAIEDKDRREATVAAVNADHREMLADPKKLGKSVLDLKTKEGRRVARQLESEVSRMVKAEQKKHEAREAGLAEQRGGTGSALEFLLNTRCLRDGADSTGDKQKTSEEQRRLEAGMRLRKYVEGTRVGGLGAIDYERATMGSSSGPALGASAYKLQCINAIGSIRKLMSQLDYAMIEAVVDQDIFVWEKAPPKSKTRANIFRAIRYYLDVVAVHESLMTREAFTDRWDEVLPLVERKGYGDAAALSGAAAEFLEMAR